MIENLTQRDEFSLSPASRRISKFIHADSVYTTNSVGASATQKGNKQVATHQDIIGDQKVYLAKTLNYIFLTKV